jgi:hypothetical protein
VIDDLHRGNGTLPNDGRIRSNRLTPEDRIGFGDRKPSFLADTDNVFDNLLVARLVRTRPIKQLS